MSLHIYAQDCELQFNMPTIKMGVLLVLHNYFQQIFHSRSLNRNCPKSTVLQKTKSFINF